MITYNAILQGDEATEENARNFAQGYDFSQDETEEYNKDFKSIYIDTVNGIKIYYNMVADYYFFADQDKPMTHYVDYMGPENNFKEARKEFTSYEDARRWCLETMEKFDPDYIKVYFDEQS